MAAPSSATAAECQLLPLSHKQPRHILSGLPVPELCEVFSDVTSEDWPPEDIACGTLCVCSAGPCPPALPHRRAAALKRPRSPPCFTGTINVPPPPPSLSLSEVSSLYWMVQKQNHKPISVTLAMRLDGPNLSPSGAIGSTPVSLERPLSSRQRGSFLFGHVCTRALAVHVTHSNLHSSAAVWGHGGTNNPIVRRVAFNEASK